MTVTKNKKGLWDVQFYCKDFTGKNKKIHRCNFQTKREAVEFVNSYIAQNNNKLDMKFKDFYKIYIDDEKERLRENTIRTKEYIVKLKILPYFGERKINEITPADIRRWQQEMLKSVYDTDRHADVEIHSIKNEKVKYSQTYLKTINNQLSAIFNYACRYYDLARNPCRVAGPIGKGDADEMEIWTQQEFEDFLDFVSDKPVSRCAFLMLYWTGCRIGELLALTVSDIDLEEKKIAITKSYQRIRGKAVVTEPKTEAGKRVIDIPDFLVKEIEEYMSKLYGIMPGDRLFNITKSYMEHEMLRGIELSGVKKIRIHDLRHSHASFLICVLGAQPKQVAKRLGHKKIQTTLNTYAHLFPGMQEDLIDKMEKAVGGEE